MTKCAECGGSLEGSQVIADPEGPMNPGEEIPRRSDHPLYDEEVGYVVCRHCSSERPLTPHQWWRNQDPKNTEGGWLETL